MLVNNLGIFEPKALLEIPDKDWLRFYEVNLMSGVRLTRHYLPGMIGKNWGRVIPISSESGQQTPGEMVHYGMTKTAQIAVARGVAESVAGTGITVNSILAGPTASEGVGDFVQSMAAQQGITKDQVEQEFFEKIRPSSLLKPFETTEEVAAVVAFVASTQAVSINGTAVRAEGGVVRSIFIKRELIPAGNPPASSAPSALLPCGRLFFRPALYAPVPAVPHRSRIAAKPAERL